MWFNGPKNMASNGYQILQLKLNFFQFQYTVWGLAESYEILDISFDTDLKTEKIKKRNFVSVLSVYSNYFPVPNPKSLFLELISRMK